MVNFRLGRINDSALVYLYNALDAEKILTNDEKSYPNATMQKKRSFSITNGTLTSFKIRIPRDRKTGGEFMMMKLAGFYGLTAPQLILLYDSFGIEKIEKLGSKLINAVDRVNIINAKNELYYLNASLVRLILYTQSHLRLHFLIQKMQL